MFGAGAWILLVAWSITFLLRWRSKASKVEINKKHRL
jgi:hypothetical protein